MRILVVGATGLVGRACVRRLVASPGITRVVALVRRPWSDAPASDKLLVQVAALAKPDLDGAGGQVDTVLCALGTTMRQAGSEAAFRLVDYEYPLAVGRAALAHGVRHYLLVSALGANAASRVFYNRVKGEVERDLGTLGFASLTIARPSLLMGPRAESRPLERLMGAFGWAMPGRWKPVRAEQVAAALVHHALHPTPGIRVLENAELRTH